MSRSLVLTVVAAVLTAVAACALSVAGLRSAPAPVPLVSSGSTAAPAPADPPAVAVVRAWDARRSAAWARGDPEALLSLYTAGSAAGAHDLAMLTAWRERGLRVTGLRTQLLSVDDLGRTPQRWRLRVTDRVVGGTVVGSVDGMRVRRSLPADRASTRTLVLRSVLGEWRVASVREGGGA
jgi:hypothetical protein